MANRPELLFDRSQLQSKAPYRVFCFPYAGGGYGVFSSWQRHCDGRLNILGVRLPGRGVRYNEAPYREFESLLNDLEIGMAPFLDRPFMLFGHSVGALVAYELARRVRTSARAPLLHLFVAACRAPHCRSPQSAVIDKSDHLLDDRSLADKLATIGGMPANAVSKAELLRVSLPVIRADFQVYDSYRPPAEPSGLTCPVSALGGRSDLSDVPAESLQEWSRYTRGEFQLRWFAGGHFFLNPHVEDILKCVLEALP
jgi:medium-chain acyl-[acyl-carrier-protein] hydrolase